MICQQIYNKISDWLGSEERRSWSRTGTCTKLLLSILDLDKDILPFMSIKQALNRLQPILRTMSTSPPQSALATFSSCEISDALIKLGLPHGGHIPDIRMLSPTTSGETRLCGPAYTVQMVPGSDKTSPKLSSHFVDTAPSGSVIVIDAPPRSVCFLPSPHYSTLRQILCTRAFETHSDSNQMSRTLSGAD